MIFSLRFESSVFREPGRCYGCERIPGAMSVSDPIAPYPLRRLARSPRLILLPCNSSITAELVPIIQNLRPPFLGRSLPLRTSLGDSLSSEFHFARLLLCSARRSPHVYIIHSTLRYVYSILRCVTPPMPSGETRCLRKETKRRYSERGPGRVSGPRIHNVDAVCG